MTGLTALRFGGPALTAQSAPKFGFAGGAFTPGAPTNSDGSQSSGFLGALHTPQLPSLAGITSSLHLPPMPNMANLSSHLPWQHPQAAPAPRSAESMAGSPIARAAAPAPAQAVSGPVASASAGPAPAPASRSVAPGEMTFVAKLPPMAFPLTASSQQMAQMQAVWAAQQAQLMAAAESALRQAYARSQQEAKQESMAYHLQHKGGMPASIANNSKLIRYNPFMLPPVEAYNNFSADQKAGVSPPWIDPQLLSGQTYRNYYFPNA